MSFIIYSPIFIYFSSIKPLNCLITYWLDDNIFPENITKNPRKKRNKFFILKNLDEAVRKALYLYFFVSISKMSSTKIQ